MCRFCKRKLCVLVSLEESSVKWGVSSMRIALCAFFCTKKLDILVGIPYWKGCHYVHFSQTKKTLHVLVGLPWWKGVTLSISTKKLGVLVGLPFWKWRHYVQFCKSNCMSLLVYPSERASLCTFFAKENCVSLLAYPIEKGVTMCIFCKQSCMFLLAYLTKSGVTYAFLQKNSWPTLLQKTSLCLSLLQKKTVCPC